MSAFKKFLFSFQTTLVYLLIFIVSIAVATFIENDHGADTAKALVYNAWWFELLLALICLNFIGNVFIGKLFRKEKLTTLLFHTAFILIVIGAGVTRYLGEEGMMHIRQGQSQSIISTSDYYLQVKTQSNDKEEIWNKKLLLSNASKNRLNKKFQLGKKQISVTLESFLPDAITSLQPDEKGKPYITLVLAGANGREEYNLAEGDFITKNGIPISFGNSTQTSGIYIERQADSLTVISKVPLEIVSMGNQGSVTNLDTAKKSRFNPLTLYRSGSATMVMKQYLPGASLKAMPNEQIIKDKNTADALIVTFSSGNDQKTITLWGGKGFDGEEQIFQLDSIMLSASFGSIWKQLPFSLQLNKFKLERYPGSNSPASFQSNVTLIDNDRKYFQLDSIYMNNVLYYGGYRFYQSSYDDDELGTYLSVNDDVPGTWITYLGYLLLAIGMFANLLNPASRFRWLLRQGTSAGSTVKVFILMTLVSLFSTQLSHASISDSLTVDYAEAQNFGSLLVQDRKGRVEPISTLASEIIRKVSRSSNFKGLTSEQVFLGMNVYPENWKTIPMIKISHPGLQELFRTDLNLVSFDDCFDLSGNYRLSEAVNAAYQKKPSSRNKFDSEVIRADERINICYMVYTGQYLNVFPKAGDPNNTWLSPNEVAGNFTGMDSMFSANILSLYFEAVRNLDNAKSKQEASTYLESIKNYQKKLGEKVLLSPGRVKLEILYNKFDVFSRLMKYYGLFGGILLLFQFITIFVPRFRQKYVEKGLILILFVSFLLHTAGLLVRWYLSGHAPWSNGFESLTYIAWATVLAGIFFSRKSAIAISATALLASVILSVAHLTWMDPEITNVVPVLNSYWLSIHVSVISASYGFFALGALLGFLNLLLMFFRNEKNSASFRQIISQLSNIAETTLILGLFLVSIGTFLGGIWANESWGRYWGWDPKETWALITVLVYAFVAHMRFVPGLKSAFVFNFAALISFSSVIMTYFGVNFYLSGLHSYGKGDPIPIPGWIYYALFVVFAISVLAYVNERKMNKGELKQES